MPFKVAILAALARRVGAEMEHHQITAVLEDAQNEQQTQGQHDRRFDQRAAASRRSDQASSGCGHGHGAKANRAIAY
jgi:hypothetical protein